MYIKTFPNFLLITSPTLSKSPDNFLFLPVRRPEKLKLCRVGDVATASALSFGFSTHSRISQPPHRPPNSSKTQPHPHSEFNSVKPRLRYTFQQLLHGKLAPTTTAAATKTTFQPCPRVSPTPSACHYHPPPAPAPISPISMWRVQRCGCGSNNNFRGSGKSQDTLR